MADQTPKANAGKDVTDIDALTARTEYLILKALEPKGPAGAINDGVPENSWTRVQLVTATSATAAIRACVSKLAEKAQAGTFVAVPARSWKPVSVNPQTTIRLELTEAKP